jgi:hypothetical protein
MRYALLIFKDESAVVSDEEMSGRFAAFAEFAERMSARGVLLGGERLQPTATATTVRVRGGDVVIADGPFAETKEQIGGLFVTDLPDLDEAIRIASLVPAADYGSLEIRPIVEQ